MAAIVEKIIHQHTKRGTLSFVKSIIILGEPFIRVCVPSIQGTSCCYDKDISRNPLYHRDG